MKIFLIRVFTVIFFVFIFLFVLLFKPGLYSSVSSESGEIFERTLEKKVLKIPVKYVSSKSSSNGFSSESTFSETAELSPESTESVSFNLNSETPLNLVPPDLDLNKVYSSIVYPLSMKKRNIECVFSLTVYVLSDGTVNLVFPNEVRPEFVSSVKVAFKGAAAKPATLNGMPVDVYFSMPVAFVLK